MSLGINGPLGLRSTALSLSQQYQKHKSQLEFSLTRLASGDKMVLPGRDPAGLSISERIKAQVTAQEKGLENIQTNISLLNSSGDYLDQLNSIILRMTELASAATLVIPQEIGSAENPKLTNLNAEYQLLKDEYKYVTRESDFNEHNIVGQEYLLSYDGANKRMRYWSSTGIGESEISQEFSEDAVDANGQSLNFDSSLKFTMGGEGRYLYYIGKPTSTTYDVRRLDLQSQTMNVLSTGGDTTTRFTPDKNSEIFVDENGMVYVSDDQATKNIYKINPNSLVREKIFTGAAEGGSFSVYNDVVSYADINTGPPYTFSMMEYNISTAATSFGSTYTLPSSSIGAGAQLDSISFSVTGKYIAGISDTGKVFAYNKEKETSVVYTLSGTPEITDLRFNSDENRLYYTNLTSKTIGYLELNENLEGQISLAEAGNVVQGTNTSSFLGLSMGGVSPGVNGSIGYSANAASIDYSLADARMWKMGLLPTNLKTRDNAVSALAALQTAVGKLAEEKTKIAGYALSMQMTVPALEQYNSELASTYDRLRNVDVAKETAEITFQRMRTEAAMAVLAKFNNVAQSALQLLTSL